MKNKVRTNIQTQASTKECLTPIQTHMNAERAELISLLQDSDDLLERLKNNQRRITAGKSRLGLLLQMQRESGEFDDQESSIRHVFRNASARGVKNKHLRSLMSNRDDYVRARRAVVKNRKISVKREGFDLIIRAESGNPA